MYPHSTASSLTSLPTKSHLFACANLRRDAESAAVMNHEHVAIFWDYENCAPPTSTPGYDVVNNIRQVAHEYGSVKLFKAYLELSEQSSSKSIGLRSELQSCGVSLTDCPHNGRKDVADKMMIVDMLTYAIDNPAPATIILISGDRDFVYAVSVLRLRRYRVVLVAPNCAHASLKSQASALLNWETDIMGSTSYRPQTKDWPNKHSNDAGQPTPRRASLSGQLSHTTPKHAHSSSCETSIRPVGLDSDGQIDPSTFRHASFAITDPCLAFGTLQEMVHMEPMSAQPPIPDIVDFIQDIQRTALHTPSWSEPTSDIPNIRQKSLTILEPPSVPIPQSAQTVVSTQDLHNDHDSAIMLSRHVPLVPDSVTSPRLAFKVPNMLSGTLRPSSDIPSEDSSVSGSMAAELLLESDATPPTPELCVDESTININPILNTVQSFHSTDKGKPVLYSPPAAPELPLSGVSLSIPQYFHPLVEVLEEARLSGSHQPLRSWVGLKIPRGIYSQAKVTAFKHYAAAAEQAGLIELGGSQANAWISLRPQWHGRVPIHRIA